MIETHTLVAGGGAFSLFVLALWSWRIQMVASVARTLAVVLAVLGVLVVAGVVDLERAAELVRTIHDTV